MTSGREQKRAISNYTEQSPSGEVHRSSDGKEIPRVLWNPKAHYFFYNNPSTFPYPKPDWSSPQYPLFPFLNIYFNIILPSMLNSSKCFLYLGFPHQNPVCTSSFPHARYRHCLSYSFLFDRPNNIWRRSTDHKAPLYVVISTPLFPRTS